MSNLRIRRARIAGILLGACGFVGLISSFFISTWHLQNAPLLANPSTEEIYPVTLRGETIYLDRFDYAIQTYLFPSMVLVCIVGGALMSWAKRHDSAQ